MIFFQRTNGVCQHLAMCISSFSVTGSDTLDRSDVKGETFVLAPGSEIFSTIIAEKEYVSDLFRYWLARKQRAQLEPEDDITFKGIPLVSCFLQPDPMSYRCHRHQVEGLSVTEETWGAFPIQTGAFLLCSIVK